MAKNDPRIDAYIAKSAEFAQPILKHLRELVHQTCPAVQETLKWSMPSFVHKGLLCMMAACLSMSATPTGIRLSFMASALQANERL